MRTTAGFDAHDTFDRQGAGSSQELSVFLGIDIVGDRCDVVPVTEVLAQCVHKRGLAGADGAADTHAQRAVGGHGHERNNLVYWVSCRMAARSDRKVHPPRSSRVASLVFAATPSIAGSSAASTRSPAVWPSGTRRTAADIRLVTVA